MKLCCININAAETSQAFLPVLCRDIELAKQPGTEIVVESVTPGLQRALDVNSAYFSLLNKASIVDAAIRASRSCDAIVVICFLDPALTEAREMVDVPVVGLAEASTLLACQIGRKFAIVTLDEPKMIVEIERNLGLLGLEDRATRDPVIPIDIPSQDWLKRGMDNPALVADAVDRAARKGLANGADVIIVGCAGMAPLASLGGLTQIGNARVPIIDCVQAGIKMAEFRVELMKRPGWPAISRGGIYAAPDERDIERVRSTFGRE
ncbi:MAG TPA: aspartate/glutamate racemase family protein [Nitrobacter sp.]|jgi:allantoin racemase|nr:aspartate/glutamate racemase family protein [Nitrobacter sp.]